MKKKKMKEKKKMMMIMMMIVIIKRVMHSSKDFLCLNLEINLKNFS